MIILLYTVIVTVIHHSSTIYYQTDYYCAIGYRIVTIHISSYQLHKLSNANCIL